MTWSNAIISTVLALTVTCGGNPKPTTTPEPPTGRTVHITVRSAETKDIVTPVTATLVADNPEVGSAGLAYPATNDPSGRLTFSLDTKVPQGAWGATIHIDAPAFDPFETREILADDLVDVFLTPAFRGLPRPVPSGRFFTVEGNRFTIIEASSFKLYKRYLEEGPDAIRPVLAQLQDLGFNMVRVFGMAQNLWPFHPVDYGDRYYTELPAFVNLLGRYGLYLEFTAFADTQMILPDLGAEQAHWLRLGTTLDGLPVLLELGNELDQHDNAVTNLALFNPPANVCASHGSNGADSVPPRPAWCYELYHSNGLNEWWRKVGHNAMEFSDQSGKPAFSNENTRAPDAFASLTQATDAAAGATLLAAGSCFHFVSGRDSALMTDTEVPIARAWVVGAKSVPPSCQAGAYSHRADLETAGILRAYQRGSDPACVVLIRR